MKQSENEALYRFSSSNSKSHIMCFWGIDLYSAICPYLISVKLVFPTIRRSGLSDVNICLPISHNYYLRGGALCQSLYITLHFTPNSHSSPSVIIWYHLRSSTTIAMTVWHTAPKERRKHTHTHTHTHNRQTVNYSSVSLSVSLFLPVRSQRASWLHVASASLSASRTGAMMVN